jgi:hypothetical protein
MVVVCHNAGQLVMFMTTMAPCADEMYRVGRNHPQILPSSASIGGAYNELAQISFPPRHMWAPMSSAPWMFRLHDLVQFPESKVLRF